MPRLSKPSNTSTPTIGEVVAMWRGDLVAKNRTEKTIRTYLYGVGFLVESVGALRPIDRITRADHERVLADLFSQGWKPASVSAVYRPMRTFWQFVVGHQDIPVATSPMLGMFPPKLPRVERDYVTDAELRRILATCASTSRHNYRGRRDEAIIRILATTGARLGEVASMLVSGVMADYSTILVDGKTGERRLPLDEPTKGALMLYMGRERARSPFAKDPRVWLGPKGAMTDSGIAQMVAERGKAAGLERRIHPHELRHRFVAKALAAGLPETYVMAITGHQSRQMIDLYGRKGRVDEAHEAFRRAAASGAIPKL